MLSIINRSMGNNNARGNSVYSIDTMHHLKWTKGNIIPEVTKFSPFVRPVRPYVAPTTRTTSRPRSGVSGGVSATIRANEKWMNRTPSGIGSSEKVLINSILRKIPGGHVGALNDYYNLKTSDELRFTPEKFDYLTKHKQMVYGDIIHPRWGYQPWEAIIYNVPTIQANAYEYRDWLVRPIGLASPRQRNADLGVILCELIHCDWAGYNTPLEDEDKGQIMIHGPDGRLIGASRLHKLIDSGCVNCGCNLKVTNTNRYAYANDGQDILCYDCIWETITDDRGEGNETTH